MTVFRTVGFSSGGGLVGKLAPRRCHALTEREHNFSRHRPKILRRFSGEPRFHVSGNPKTEVWVIPCHEHLALTTVVTKPRWFIAVNTTVVHIPEMARDDPQLKLRLPADLKARIEAEAAKNHRSVNSEIVRTLDAGYPPEPSIPDLINSVHWMIELAQKESSLPYRQRLLDALEALQRRLASGMEFDPIRVRDVLADKSVDLMRLHDRWNRASKVGVAQEDLEYELAHGVFNYAKRSAVQAAITMLRAGRLDRAMAALSMRSVKFADPDAAKRALEDHLTKLYEEKWGDPTAPWNPDESDDE